MTKEKEEVKEETKLDATYVESGVKDVASMSLLQKLSAITNELSWVAKNLKVDTGNGKSYDAVSEGDILKAVKPAEEKYHVYSFPLSREVFDQNEFTNKYGTLNRYARMAVTYRFVNIDNSSEFIDIQSFGEALDSGDKGLGKAMTYADKYALMKAYKIQTGDDPDAVASPKDTPEDTSKAILDYQKAMQELSDAGQNPRDEAVIEWIKKTASVNTIDKGHMSNIELQRATEAYRILAKIASDKKEKPMSPTDNVETY